MHIPRSLKTSAAILCAGVIFLFSFWIRARSAPDFLIDDAYITLRVVNNFISGEGLVYNPGERLLSTTTPAYVIALAPFAYLTGDTIGSALRFNALCAALTCLCLIWLGRKITGRIEVGLGAALCFAIVPSSVLYSMLGMETPFYALMLMAGVVAFAAGRMYAAALICALLPIVRPDGIILSGIIAFGIIAKLRSQWWKPALAALAAATPWLVFATLYYGSPIPHSLLEKARFFKDRLFGHDFAGMVRQWTYHYYSLFNDEPIYWLQLFTTPYDIMLSRSLVYIACFVAAAIIVSRKHPVLLPAVFFPVAYALLFCFGGTGSPFYWYFIATDPFFLLTTLCGMFFILQESLSKLSAFTNRPQHAPSFAAWMVFSYCAIFFVIRFAADYTPGPKMFPEAIEKHVPRLREPVYVEIAEYLNGFHCPSNTLVYCAEVGALGYFCNYKVWDGHLTTPRYIPERGEALIRKYRPTFITFMGFFNIAPPLNAQPAEWVLNKRGDKYMKIHQVNRGDTANRNHTCVVYKFIPADTGLSER